MGCGASKAPRAPAGDIIDAASQAAASRAKKGAAAAANVAVPEVDDDENGHAPLLEKFAASRATWGAMNRKATAPAHDMCWPLALVADQDEDSKTAEGWQSYLAYGALIYRGDKGSASYSIELQGECRALTGRGDKSERGAEYSALEIFQGKLVTFCDRTGNMDELLPGEEKFSFQLQPVRAAGPDGEPVVLVMGDGTKKKPLKCEWSAQRDGKLYIGSTGKERTDDDGNIVHEGEMWVKVIDENMNVEHLDFRPVYASLRAAAICPQGAGCESRSTRAIRAGALTTVVWCQI